MPESDNSRKRALECLRLEADCMQLAGVVHGPALQTHFVRMAREWSSLAVQGRVRRVLRLRTEPRWSLTSPRAEFSDSRSRAFNVTPGPFTWCVALLYRPEPQSKGGVRKASNRSLTTA